MEEWRRGKGKSSYQEPDKLTVLVVEGCEVWTPAGGSYLWKQGLAAGNCHFPSVVYSL